MHAGEAEGDAQTARTDGTRWRARTRGEGEEEAAKRREQGRVVVDVRAAQGQPGGGREVGDNEKEEGL